MPETPKRGVDRGPNKVYQSMGRYLGMAFLLPLCVVIGYAIGLGLDHLFGTHFLYIVFLLFGIAAGFVELIRDLKKDSGNSGT